MRSFRFRLSSLKVRNFFVVVFILLFVKLSLNKFYFEQPIEESTEESIEESTQEPHIDPIYFNLVIDPAPLCKTPKRLSYDTLLEQNDRYVKLRHQQKNKSLNETLQKTKSFAGPVDVQPVGNQYFFAMNLYNNQELIPHILQELLRLFEYLGPQNIYFSLYENGSTDSSKYILSMFKVTLDRLEIRNTIVVDKKRKPKNAHRIEYLAKARNKALESLETESSNGRTYDKIVFINDVVFCRNDILELLYQSDLQQSDMTCPLDFNSGGVTDKTIRFRDTWIARDLNGKSFKEPLSSIVSHKESLNRFKKNLPFQVQCCWNGAVVLNPKPFYKPNSLRFRRGNKKVNECSASECSLMCNDFWENGFRKIVTVPRVLVPYKLKDFKLLDNYDRRNRIPSPVEEKIKYIDGPEKIECRGLEKPGAIRPDQPIIWVKYTTNGTAVN
ncbi:hypothetical protein BB559_004881 [Furculomyces boomerangus]|uniref:Alpha-1,3-mannosyltransferase CMT1 n=2 Tax=Harpellales TaxID=61421 RepID=A0A2T9YC69_9FUNG|nr:hypothetical protein BB559_004881 [Furculomyces boomerangus]PVZ98577.1 hypothetical protein BB558_005421 [Smittium angustum]